MTLNTNNNNTLWHKWTTSCLESWNAASFYIWLMQGQLLNFNAGVIKIIKLNDSKSWTGRRPTGDDIPLPLLIWHSTLNAINLIWIVDENLRLFHLQLKSYECFLICSITKTFDLQSAVDCRIWGTNSLNGLHSKLHTAGIFLVPEVINILISELCAGMQNGENMQFQFTKKHLFYFSSSFSCKRLLFILSDDILRKLTTLSKEIHSVM